MTSTPSPRDTVARELAAWTHMWITAATAVLSQLEDSWDDAEPASSIGSRDALSLVIIDAVRNVYRGARAVLPDGANALAEFEREQPHLVSIRDFFEHFDEYVSGRGRVQKRAATEPDDSVAMNLRRSSSALDGGHSMVFAVREGADRREYEVLPADAVAAARRLARSTLEYAGLVDSRHLEHCGLCAQLGG